MDNKILITGAAGFIGFHLTKRLANDGYEIICIDNINDYYSTKLKKDRLKNLGFVIENSPNYDCEIKSSKFSNISFYKIDIAEKNETEFLFSKEKFSIVYNLAAQAGVRFSITNPEVYTKSNLVGFFNILHNCSQNGVKHLVFASSSSVYGNSDKIPFKENLQIDRPVSYYAATKKSNELMAYSYSKIYKISITGLRYFTVYGPWGRPDMAPFLFCNGIRNKNSIDVFNNGDLMRDFTYIDDIIDGTILAGNNPNLNNCQIFNIGCGSPVNLLDFIKTIENEIGINANLNFRNMQRGDVYKTWADIRELSNLGYKPNVKISEGIKKYVRWFLNYYNEN